MLFTYVELNNELYNPTEPDGVNTSASALEFKFTWFLENLKLGKGIMLGEMFYFFFHIFFKITISVA